MEQLKKLIEEATRHVGRGTDTLKVQPALMIFSG